MGDDHTMLPRILAVVRESDPMDVRREGAVTSARCSATGTSMGSFQRFFRLESLAGILLVIAALVGLAIANSPLSDAYLRLFDTKLTVAFGKDGLSKPLLLWINDGLMAIFFLLVALELKREIVEGELSNRSQVALPLAAAFGGMVIPALIYVGFNWGDAEALRGWAIPAATDIAFALGVLALVGDRVPKSLKTFLLSLAVFDDLGAILVIALFYTEKVSWAMHGMAAIATLGLVGLNLVGAKRLGPYFFLGALLWLFVLKSGVHATLAGVVLGLTIPMRARDGSSPLVWLEHTLHPYVAVCVVPLFAFANAGVDLRGLGPAQLVDPVALGIAAGLLVGKTVGVAGVVWLAVKVGIAKIPKEWTATAFFGVAVLAGIGFTMSLFIGTLAFEDAGPGKAAAVRLGVLGGSLVAAVLGFVLVQRGVARNEVQTPTAPAGASH
jgi:NhaA family Na+:H+ antiporter